MMQCDGWGNQADTNNRHLSTLTGLIDSYGVSSEVT